MVSLRTAKVTKAYLEYVKNGGLLDSCPLCVKESVKDFQFWRIVKNNFPYDRIAKVHHMLIPLRHVPEDALTLEEVKELREIKKIFVSDSYTWIIEPTMKHKTIPAHFHLHLIVGKS